MVEGRTVVRGRGPVGPTTTTVPVGPMGREELEAMNAWWRTANYLALGQKVLRLLEDTRVLLTKCSVSSSPWGPWFPEPAAPG